MNLDQIELKKTAILFFDILNGYYHEASDANKARKKPMVEGAVRLMKAGRQAGIPIFFAKGDHRSDGATSASILTDTKIDLKPWPNGVVTKDKPVALHGGSGSEVIPELDPRPDDYYIPKYRWSAFYQTHLDLALRTAKRDTLIVSGGSTDVGVAATVFAGRDLDYNMIVVRDACATIHDQRAHDVLMDLMFPRMCRIRTVDQVLQMIKEAGGK
ncbi:MAG TPA: isochorismatase family cysteine hydrolase [Candidatus Binatia bacterium]|nr:isochorismatase family cysteine hydrolase [Candidatus Binatia bacterium]